MKRSCVFKRMIHNRYQHTEMADNALYEANTMFTVEWRFDDKKVGKVNVFCAPAPTLCCTHRPQPRAAVTQGVCWAPEPRACRTDDPSFIGYFFSALSTPAVDNFVCKTMRDSCADVWAANDLTSCEPNKTGLPYWHGGGACTTSKDCPGFGAGTDHQQNPGSCVEGKSLSDCLTLSRCLAVLLTHWLLLGSAG